MPRLEKVSVDLTVPLIGKITGTWLPDDLERRASWELYIELTTRVSVVPLKPDEGSLREALNSLYSLFTTTREVLKRYGPSLAQVHRKGSLSFAYLALAVLNGELRPILSSWHPELMAHEHARPVASSPLEWEKTWPQSRSLRSDLQQTREVLKDYASILAQAAGAPPLHLAVAEEVSAPGR